jgi:allantoicase
MSSEITEPEFTQLIDLASERLEGKVLTCSDDFFASMHNLIKPGRGIFIEDKYTENGKWMDGWESRRKRETGHDWCIIRLGAPGIIQGFDVDTNHFLGNHPPQCSIEACFSEDDNLDEENWQEILPKSSLEAGSQNFFEINSSNHWTHVKLHIYPDGGVARLKVYGEVKLDWEKMDRTKVLDLAAAVNGGKSILCNDMFFSPMDNLIMPGKGENMGDGWETKRSRRPDHRDWVIIRLARKGKIQKIIVDTCHFKGNYPDSCMIEGCDTVEEENIENQSWKCLLPQMKLQAHWGHIFENEIENSGPYTHVRLSIFPDGGVSRLRLWGTID